MLFLYWLVDLCEEFSQEFVKLYHEVNKNGKVFEIIVVSSDDTKTSFKEY